MVKRHALLVSRKLGMRHEMDVSIEVTGLITIVMSVLSSLATLSFDHAYVVTHSAEQGIALLHFQK